MLIQRVCVYCASSRQCDGIYFASAERLGRELARNGMTIIYGGGAVGLMGCLADNALSEGGEVIGVLPRFMEKVEWGHKGLTELRIVRNMHERNRIMIEEADAFVALPGGCGTLGELFEAITWKRLGLHTKPIIMANIRGFYDPCIELLERCITERFMGEQHQLMWTVVDSAEEVIDALRVATPWDENAIDFAAL